MQEYKLAISNAGKILIFALLTILSVPALVYILFEIDNQFIRSNPFIMILIILIPALILTIWLITNQNRDGLKISNIGIESNNLGTIKWHEIAFCSWEMIRGSFSVYIKLKDNTRLSVGSLSSWKNYSKGYNELINFFVEIQKINNELPENEKFKIYNGKLSNIYTIGFIIFFIGLLIFTVVFNMIKK